MGTVTIMPETTKDPISLIGRCAGVCWGKDTADQEANYRRGLDCIKSGHGRTLEYVDIYAVIDGYSARVIREWYTHIGGAPTRLQASTRYIDYSNLDMVIPETIERNEPALRCYMSVKDMIEDAYHAMTAAGVPREDAANILPLGMKTKIMDKRNLRNVMDMSRQRMCTRAYEEYRWMFGDYVRALNGYSDEWRELLPMVVMSKCEELGYCVEKNSCGYMPRKEQ